MKNLNLNAEILNKIKKISTFRFLNDHELESLVRISEIEQFDIDEKVISQGEINQSFYTIINGTVKVTVQEENRNEAYICTIGDGEIFGEAGLFTKVKRTANVICSADTLLMKIPRDSMFTFIKNHPRSGNKILMLVIFSLLKKLKEVNQELAYERKSDADQDDIDSIINSFMD